MTARRFPPPWTFEETSDVKISEVEFQAVAEKAVSVAVVVQVYRKLKR
jgi:NADH:ubiquinone oxidoreductase subunit K